MKTHTMKTREWQRITQAKTSSWRGLLIANWTRYAGSTLRPGISPRQVSGDELSSLWADAQATNAPPADAS
jgi:hypothetical protein